MSGPEDPSGFDTIVGRPEYYIEFLDARTSLDDELHVKQVIASLLQPEDGLTVLDVGTGTGADAAAIAGLVAPSGKVVGVDHSADMVEELAGASQVRICRSSSSREMPRHSTSRTVPSTVAGPNGCSCIFPIRSPPSGRLPE